MPPPRAIAGRSPDATPYGHLVPVLEAELGWGNSTDDGFVLQRDGWWHAQLRDPLHLDLLQAEFLFPAHVRVGRGIDGLTFVADDAARVEIGALSPPPRRPALGLLDRLRRRS